MKTLKFAKHLVPLVISGEKTSTWRLFDDKQLTVGDDLMFIDSSTGLQFSKAKITKIKVKKLGEITERDYDGHEKFESKQAMLDSYRSYYGDEVDEKTEVKLIDFVLLDFKEDIRKGVDCIGITTVFYCHDGNGRFVMSLRNDRARDENGTWDIGGGGLDTHDTVEESLAREIKEEYCTEIISKEFIGYRDVHRTYNGNKTHWIALDFKVQVDPDKVANGEPHKFDRVEWFTLDTLPENLHSQLSLFFEKYSEQL